MPSDFDDDEVECFTQATGMIFIYVVVWQVSKGSEGGGYDSSIAVRTEVECTLAYLRDCCGLSTTKQHVTVLERTPRAGCVSMNQLDCCSLLGPPLIFTTCAVGDFYLFFSSVHLSETLGLVLLSKKTGH